MYRELTPDQQTHVLREHVLNLEAEHYRLRLALAEEVDGTRRAAILERIAECERRITVHAGGVGAAEPGQDEDPPVQ